ncbi:MAG: chemotaxis protein CheX [Lachnospiraceae bacterium]|nr:chemotaxis protein CheX [Lachnospiraceae bacterium]
MFTQLFGNYLLRKAIITPEELLECMTEAGKSHAKLGTLCIHAGLMSSAEVEKVYILQTHRDERFGEIAIEEGYLTQEQLDNLMEQQPPSYILLAQCLTEKGILNHDEVERLLADYQMETELYDLEMMEDHKDRFKKMVTHFCNFSDLRNGEVGVCYLQLLFNNLIRFIGDDFTPMDLVPFQEYITHYGAKQSIEGSFQLQSAIETNEQAAIAFASRYAGENFEEYDEFVSASLQDFLNLHNGLFVVNMSNSDAVELEIDAPEEIDNMLYAPDGYTYLLPLAFTFGTVNFLITFAK